MRRGGLQQLHGAGTPRAAVSLLLQSPNLISSLQQLLIPDTLGWDASPHPKLKPGQTRPWKNQRLLTVACSC